MLWPCADLVTRFWLVHAIISDAPLPTSSRSEQTMAMPVTRHWTTADVRALMREDRAWPRYELIDGELIVTPAPRTPHQVAVSEFHVLLHGYLQQNGLGVVITAPYDLELKPATITQPDVFVMPNYSAFDDDELEVAEATDVRELLLAIEVLSPSSIRIDRVVKRDFYLANGVMDYWIVDLDARVVERWRPTQERPELLRDAIEWAPAGRDPLHIDLLALFDRVEAISVAVERFLSGPARKFRRRSRFDSEDT
jgi:Uma2 family endonuclease